MIKVVLAALAVMALGPPAAFGEPAAAPRAEVPITEVVLSNGTRRYTVPITVGGVQIEAGLDSGSTGLRILASALAQDGVEAGARRTSYSYSSGTRLDGVVADEMLSIGVAAGSSPVQLVTSAGCTQAEPQCPARRIPFSQYGIQGDGLAGQGFKAILGINMGPAEVPNPLERIGVRRWIIELPRPGQTTPGRLVLNPSDDEVQGYTLFHVTAGEGGLHDALEGCLLNGQTHRSICGDAVLDTGAPGIRVVMSDAGAAWPNGTPGTIAFADGGRTRTGFDFTVGQRSQASHLEMQPHDGVRTPRLFLGLTPYFAYSVLYDPQTGSVGLKSRPN